MIIPYLETELLSEYRDRLRGRKVLRFVDSVDLSQSCERRYRSLYKLDHGFLTVTIVANSTWDPSQSDLDFFETQEAAAATLQDFVRHYSR